MATKGIFHLILIILATTLTVSGSIPEEWKEILADETFLAETGPISQELKAIFTDESLLTPTDDGSARINVRPIVTLVTDELKKLIKKGIKIPGIDISIPLDPFKTPNYLYLPILFFRNPSLIKGHIILKDILFEGLAGFDTFDEDITFIPLLNILKVRLGVRLPQLHFSFNYFKGKLAIMEMIKLHGNKGGLDLKLNNFNIHVTIEFKEKPNYHFSELSLKIELPQTESTITGLFDDERKSDIISRQLSDALQTLAKEEYDRINKIVNDFIWAYVEDNINPCLKELASLQELIELILGQRKCENVIEEAEALITKISDTLGFEIVEDNGTNTKFEL